MANDNRDNALEQLLVEFVHEKMQESHSFLGRDLQRKFYGKIMAEQAAIVMALEHIRQAITLLKMLGGVEAAADTLRMKLAELEQSQE